jgi:DNA-binding response OmpR family regulator
VTARPLVLVAHDSDGIRGVIEVLLGDAGYEVRAVADGATCLAALDGFAPAALVLDVALPDVMAFSVVETARQRHASIRVVLIASIYNRTSYKRRPTSLYGADDYVEQHHIPDSLVGKLDKLLGVAERAHDASRPAEDAVRAAGEQRLEERAPAGSSDAAGVARAERLARLIVSDIALYNGDALGGLSGGTSVAQLEARLRGDLEEGRVLFDLRIPPAIRRQRDFIGEALAKLVAEAARDGGGS